MKALRWLPAVLLVGCGSVGGTQPSGTAPSTGPTALRCTLPVVTAGGGGFIRFPGAQLRPAGGPAFSGNQLHGVGAPAYDQAFSTWVPVPVANLSPDGARYAYSVPIWPTNGQPTTTQIRVVDVQTGGDRDVYDQGAYDVVAFTKDGIYLVHHIPQTDASNGLWLLHPDTGVIHAITTSGIDWQVGGGAGWSSDLVPGDTAPGKFPADRLNHLDLATGSVVPWFTRPGFQVQVFGFDDAGNPMIVAGSDAKVELWLVTSPNMGTLVDSGPGWNDANGLTLQWPLVTDPRGVWMNSNRGIYLYRTDTHALDLVYPASWQSGTRIDVVSGACR